MDPSLCTPFNLHPIISKSDYDILRILFYCHLDQFRSVFDLILSSHFTSLFYVTRHQQLIVLFITSHFVIFFFSLKKIPKNPLFYSSMFQLEEKKQTEEKKQNVTVQDQNYFNKFLKVQKEFQVDSFKSACNLTQGEKRS